MKLRDKVILLCLFATLLSVAITALITLRISTQHIHEEAAGDLVAINVSKAEQIIRWSGDASRQLEVLGSMPVLQEKLTEEIYKAQEDDRPIDSQLLYAIIEKHLQPALHYGTFSELFLVEVTSGRIIASTDRKQIGKMHGSMPYFIKGQLETHVENIYYSMSIRQPTMVVATPIRGAATSASAVLAGRLSLATLSLILSGSSTLWETEDSYLVNNQHIFITEPRYGEQYMLRKTVFTTGVDRALARQNGTDRYLDYRGVPVIGAYHYLEDHDLALITEVDQYEYQTPINSLKRSLFFTSILLTLLVVGVGWLAARAILAPLTALTNAIDEISINNLELQFDKHDSSQELQTIVKAFKKMILRLQSSLVSRDLLQAEIDRREIVEQDLLAALEMIKRSNNELEQFAYVASHDLQEPLRMVASYNQLLAERYGPQLDEKAHKYIHYAVDGATRMQTLIQDLLAFSRVTTRGADFQPVAFDDIFKATLQNLEVMIRESGATVTGENLPVVSGDPGQLVQVLQNLIANSIKFRGQEPPVIRVEAQRQNDQYHFSVADNGIGIDQKYHEKIFVIFQRLHTREEYSGTGIGLAVCKRIVERHGGEIWFTSEPGRGTTFYFTLKAAEL